MVILKKQNFFGTFQLFIFLHKFIIKTEKSFCPAYVSFLKRWSKVPIQVGKYLVGDNSRNTNQFFLELLGVLISEYVKNTASQLHFNLPNVALFVYCEVKQNILCKQEHHFSYTQSCCLVLDFMLVNLVNSYSDPSKFCVMKRKTLVGFHVMSRKTDIFAIFCFRIVEHSFISKITF